MSFFTLPNWINRHLYPGKKYSDLSRDEIDDLKKRLSPFRHDNPDVSVMIPAWNEENNIYRALSSLASNKTSFNVEIVVINNNSTDNTQKVLDELGVRSYFQPEQGIAPARQLGLIKAKGKYHLCADSDTLYPPDWIESMIAPMKSKNIVGVYGRYSFIPSTRESRFIYWIYEKITGVLIRIRKRNHEFINVLGFNMGFITEVGRSGRGFAVDAARKFNNALGSDEFVDESEDGRMAQALLQKGELKLVTQSKARVFTSSRRLESEGGLVQSFINRLTLHKSKLIEYLTGK